MNQRIADLEARLAAVERERDNLSMLLDWYAASRLRWMGRVEAGDRYIYGLCGGRLGGVEESLPAPYAPIDRPDLREQPDYERTDEMDDLADYARDINSW